MWESEDMRSLTQTHVEAAINGYNVVDISLYTALLVTHTFTPTLGCQESGYESYLLEELFQPG